MSKCDSCIYSKVDILEFPCVDCLMGSRYDPRPQTNADRIRAMSDEELAMIICCQDHKQGDECFDASCYDCTLDWLKQEADND